MLGPSSAFDPNLRFPLWPDREALRRTVLEFLPLADIVKISDEELEFLTGTADIDTALPTLFVGNAARSTHAAAPGPTPTPAVLRTGYAALPARQGQRIPPGQDAERLYSRFCGSCTPPVLTAPRWLNGLDRCNGWTNGLRSPQIRISVQGQRVRIAIAISTPRRWACNALRRSDIPAQNVHFLPYVTFCRIPFANFMILFAEKTAFYENS